MNRISASVAALGLAATVTLAATNEVVSVNVVGYAKVNVPATSLVLCSIGFNAMEANATIQQALAGQLTGGWGFGDSDHVYLWDAAKQEYLILYKQDTGGVLPGDGWVYTDGTTATNQVLPGMAFWIESSAAVDQTCTMLGEVVSSATMNVPIVEGFNFVSYPYSADQALTNTSLKANGAVGGWGFGDSDHLYSWDVAAGQYQIFYLQDTGGVLAGDGWVNDDGSAATKAMTLAEGYWYERLPGAGAMTWSPTIPYSL